MSDSDDDSDSNVEDDDDNNDDNNTGEGGSPFDEQLDGNNGFSDGGFVDMPTSEDDITEAAESELEGVREGALVQINEEYYTGGATLEVKEG